MSNTEEDQLARFKKMLNNEHSFDRLFCDVLEEDQFNLYYNPYFSEDPVFNHANLASRVLESTVDFGEEQIADILRGIRSKAEAKQISPSIFVEQFWRNALAIEKSAIDEGYMISGKMEILSKDLKNTTLPDLTEKEGIEVFKTKDVHLWNDIFLRSYFISPSWERELLRREEIAMAGDSSATTLILAREKNHDAVASGCTLLHATQDEYLGVYCVGTLPERRNRGIARAMMRESERLAKRNGFKHLTLQTITSDGVTPMYLRLGFKTEFERDILRLP